jgi:hypothetical protein
VVQAREVSYHAAGLPIPFKDRGELMRYIVKPAEPREHEPSYQRFFIHDTEKDELVRGLNHVLLSYKTRRAAERIANRKNFHNERKRREKS